MTVKTTIIGLTLGLGAATLVACAGDAPTGLDFPLGSLSSSSSAGGGDGSGGAGGSVPMASAQQTYVDDVHEDLAAACGACHSAGVVGAPIFMADDAEASYTALVGYPGLIAPASSSNLVLKGEHSGPALDGAGVPAGLYDNVVAWLTEEAAERGLTDTTTSGGMQTGGFDQAMDDFADCMQLEAWTGLGMELVPLQNTNKGPCLGCHGNNGVGGLVLDDDTQLTFDATKSKHNLLKYVAPAYDESGGFIGLVPANRLNEKPGEPCLFDDPDDCHPDYVLDTAARDAIDAFVTYTLDALENGTCDEPYVSSP